PRRPDLDPHLPGCAGVLEAGRGSDGLGQGQSGVLGLPREAGPHPLRDGRRAAPGGGRGFRARGRQAADRDQGGAPPWRGSQRMKAKDVKAKTTDELNAELEQLTKEVFNLRFQKASGQLENTARVRDVRRTIARIKTVLGERQRAVS